jgi:hypothetical protein
VKGFLAALLLAVASTDAAGAPSSDDRSTRIIAGGVQIVRAARNPRSVEFEGIWANRDATVMCYEFRAQNGFGGMNREHVVYVKGKPDRSGSTWNARCRKDDMEEVRGFAPMIRDMAAAMR